MGVIIGTSASEPVGAQVFLIKIGIEFENEILIMCET